MPIKVSPRASLTVAIEMIGPASLARFLAIHIRSDVRPLLTDYPGVLFFVKAPEIEGTFIMHEPHGSQVFMTPLDNAQTGGRHP